MIVGITLEKNRAGLVIPLHLDKRGFVPVIYVSHRFSPNKPYPFFNIRGILQYLREETRTENEFQLGKYYKGYYGNFSLVYVGGSVYHSPEDTLESIVGIERVENIGWEGGYINIINYKEQ